MTINLPAAESFMATHARLLDRRRFQLVRGESDPAPALAALEAYRNPDGGYGRGLEPDLRSVESQPGGALHAFEVFEDVGPHISPRAGELCDWLAAASLPDGGLPFALPIGDPAGCAPFWAQADSTASSLQISAIVAAVAHRVAVHDPAVAGHPWLARCTDYCLGVIDELTQAPQAMVLGFALQFLDAVTEARPDAAGYIDRLGSFIPDNGLLHVEGGAEDETIRPLDIAPLPDRPVRKLFRPEIIDAELQRLAGMQRADGGWAVDFESYSPAAALEWRGHATVGALSILQRNGVPS